MTHSRYHIDGWLTDYECLTDIEGVGVRDVLALGQLLKGYDGTKFTCPDRRTGDQESPYGPQVA